MIDFYTDESGKPINVRRLAGSQLRGFAWPQGACSDGKNIYLIFERKAFYGLTHRCKILKLDAETLAVCKISGELRLGHGNDITYRDGVLYVTHSFGSKRIHRVDARSLRQLTGVDVVIPDKLNRKRIQCFNGIAKFGSGYILRVMGGAGMLITNENFVARRYFRTSRKYRESQGMDQKNRTTYRGYSILQSSDKNLLLTFDDSGKLIEKQRLEITGELEAIFFVGDQLCGTLYTRVEDSLGRSRRSAYVFRIY